MQLQLSGGNECSVYGKYRTIRRFFGMLTDDNDAVVLSDRRVQVRVQGSNECKLFRGGSLFHVLVDGLAEVVDGLLVTLGGGVHNAVFQMVLQYQLAGVVDG